MKFLCGNCGREVEEISVCKRLVLRDDYSLHRRFIAKDGCPPTNGPFVKDDTEYLDCKVLELIYKCPCGGEHNSVVVKGVPHLDDFIWDGDSICYEYIRQQKYGSLVVVKE